MALINCKECGKEISDQAPNCPSCGSPLKKSTQQRKGMGCGTAIVVLVVVLILAGILTNDKKDKSESASQRYKSWQEVQKIKEREEAEKRKDIESKRHLQPERQEIIQKAINSGIIMKIEKPGKLPHVFVGTKFYALPIDEKKGLLNIIYAYYLTEYPEATIVSIYDGYSGKDVGMYNEYGLDLE